MKKEKIKFDFDDILITPKKHSDIKSRFKEIDPFVKDVNVLSNRFPIFTAPMDSVVNGDNWINFNDSKIRIVLPRTHKGDIYNGSDPIFHSYGLEDFEKYFVKGEINENLKRHILLDVANGHMKQVVELVKKGKKNYPNLTIMAGNIANPETYKWYAESEAISYVRTGIGNGGGCWVDGTLIKTKNGYIDIKDIEINDSVLTHKGNYEIVTNKVSYINNKNLLEINGEICTEDHELYVINISDSDKINDENYENFAYWIEAKNLDPECHLLLSMNDDA